MSTELIRLDLRLRRRMLIGTAIGATAYLALIVAIYPSFRHDTSLDAMIPATPPPRPRSASPAPSPHPPAG